MQKFDNLGRAYQKAAPYVNASYTLIGSVVLFGLIGWWLDDYFETKPVIFMILLVLGMAAGFYSFLKVVFGLEDRDK